IQLAFGYCLLPAAYVGLTPRLALALTRGRTALLAFSVPFALVRFFLETFPLRRVGGALRVRDAFRILRARSAFHACTRMRTSTFPVRPACPVPSIVQAIPSARSVLATSSASTGFVTTSTVTTSCGSIRRCPPASAQVCLRGNHPKYGPVGY